MLAKNQPSLELLFSQLGLANSPAAIEFIYAPINCQQGYPCTMRRSGIKPNVLY